MRKSSPRNGVPSRWLNLLKTLVEINTGTANISGHIKLRKVLIPEFEALGYKASECDLKDGHKVVSLEFPNSKPELMLVGHLDTVFANQSHFQKFSANASTLTGPGVIDMKGGVVLLLNALADLKDPALLQRIRIVLNDDEEIGSVYSGTKLLALARGLRYGLVFEPGLPDGALVTAHSGVHWLELKVHGKAAHAGLEHDKGVNAGAELAHKLVQVHALTDYARKLTVNVGVIEGGTTPNVVCEQASGKLDIRFTTKADLDRTLSQIKSIAKKTWVKSPATGAVPTAEIKDLNHFPNMPDSATKVLLAMAQAAGASVGQKIIGRPVGYGSDANGLAQTGINLLVGLGPYGEGMHTDHEYMRVRSYGERLQLVLALMRKILQ